MLRVSCYSNDQQLVALNNHFHLTGDYLLSLTQAGVKVKFYSTQDMSGALQHLSKDLTKTTKQERNRAVNDCPT